MPYMKMLNRRAKVMSGLHEKERRNMSSSTARVCRAPGVNTNCNLLTDIRTERLDIGNQFMENIYNYKLSN